MIYKPRYLHYLIKCIFDYVIVTIFSPLWILIMILLIVVIKVREPKYPVFFIQNRIGRNGNEFKMIKFRTMRPNSSVDTITSANDNRITSLGSYLRKWKLDEIPELFNILFGDMSLVGPRPDVPGYADKLEGVDRLVLKLKPGITGPASLKYSNEEEILADIGDRKWFNDYVIFPDKVRINLDYYLNNNIFIDIKIIYLTLINCSKRK